VIHVCLSPFGARTLSQINGNWGGDRGPSEFYSTGKKINLSRRALQKPSTAKHGGKRIRKTHELKLHNPEGWGWKVFHLGLPKKRDYKNVY